MRRYQKFFLTLSIVLLSAFLPAAVANGQETPQLPNTFHGKVFVNVNDDIPNRSDLTLTAVIEADENVPGDKDKHYTRPISADGSYGGRAGNDPKLKVGGDAQGELLDRSEIQFSVSGALTTIQTTANRSGMVSLWAPDTENARKELGHEDWGVDGDRLLNANPLFAMPNNVVSTVDGYWVLLDAPREYFSAPPAPPAP